MPTNVLDISEPYFATVIMGIPLAEAYPASIPNPTHFF